MVARRALLDEDIGHTFVSKEYEGLSDTIV